MIALVKQLEVHRGQLLLVDDSRSFFSITNDFDKPAEQIVSELNQRCNQENLFFADLETDRRALAAPVDTL